MAERGHVSQGFRTLGRAQQMRHPQSNLGNQMTAVRM
jgi:hypothetical protein